MVPYPWPHQQDDAGVKISSSPIIANSSPSQAEHLNPTWGDIIGIDTLGHFFRIEE
jgi:hypothetical protein